MIKQIFPFAMSRSAALLAWAALLALLCSPALAIDPFQTDDVTRLTGPTFKEAVSVNPALVNPTAGNQFSCSLSAACTCCT